MNVKIIKVGYLKENCYILENKNECIVIDPGDEYNLIRNQIKYKPLAVLVTHSHFDHVGALDELIKEYKIDVFNYNNCLEKEYIIGSFKFDVIFNPGHSVDSISFYFKDCNKLFSGDFIFKDTVGRCDLKGGSILDMNSSIIKISKLYNVDIYPGHGDSTTLEYEKNNNPYFQIER